MFSAAWRCFRSVGCITYSYIVSHENAPRIDVSGVGVVLERVKGRTVLKRKI